MSSTTTATTTATKPLPTWFNFASAGTGGCIAWCFVHPFNTAAIQMNLRGAQSVSFFKFLKEVSRERGFMSLYKGLEAGIVRQIFYATSRFGLFEVIRDQVSKYREVDFASRLFSGVTSGAMAALISCPAEVTLVRISNDATLPPDQRRNYKGVFNGFTRIFAEEGFGAFFRGSGPFVNRAMLVGMVQVGTYDQFKSTYRGLGITSVFPNTFCAAMTSGLLYSLVTMPFETAKNAMAFQKPDPQSGKMLYNSTIQTISLLVKQGGPMKLYNGFLPYYLRCGGHTVGMFVAVEFIRKTCRQFVV